MNNKKKNRLTVTVSIFRQYFILKKYTIRMRNHSDNFLNIERINNIVKIQQLHYLNKTRSFFSYIQRKTSETILVV